MHDLANYGPAPANMGTGNRFENVAIPVTRLLEHIIAAGRPAAVRQVGFKKCMLHGPGLFVPDTTTRFVRCDLGDVRGDIRNLFLIAAGPRITGAIPLNDCLFEDCVFRGVGFVGNEHYVANMVRELTKSSLQG